jgi:hypothetical protein
LKDANRAAEFLIGSRRRTRQSLAYVGKSEEYDVAASMKEGRFWFSRF